MSFSGQAAVEVVLNDMKDKLRSKLGSVMAMFHSLDKDNSQNLSAEEFKTCLKEFGVVIPGHQLARLISYFDANGDGNVSIPEFAAYMSGNVDAVDARVGVSSLEQRIGFPEARECVRMRANACDRRFRCA